MLVLNKMYARIDLFQTIVLLGMLLWTGQLSAWRDPFQAGKNQAFPGITLDISKISFHGTLKYRQEMRGFLSYNNKTIWMLREGDHLPESNFVINHITNSYLLIQNTNNNVIEKLYLNSDRI